MVFEINTIDVVPERADDFPAAFAEAATKMRTLPGCRTVELMRCIESPNRFQVRISWVRIENHTEHYPTTDVAREVRALLGPMIQASQPEHYDVVRL